MILGIDFNKVYRDEIRTSIIKAEGVEKDDSPEARKARRRKVKSAEDATAEAAAA